MSPSGRHSGGVLCEESVVARSKSMKHTRRKARVQWANSGVVKTQFDDSQWARGPIPFLRNDFQRDVVLIAIDDR